MSDYQNNLLAESRERQLIPVLPLRDVVVYPHMVIPLFVGREKSILALEAAMADNKKILLLAQKNAEVDDPSQTDLYQIGSFFCSHNASGASNSQDVAFFMPAFFNQRQGFWLHIYRAAGDGNTVCDRFITNIHHMGGTLFIKMR